MENAHKCNESSKKQNEIHNEKLALFIFLNCWVVYFHKQITITCIDMAMNIVYCFLYMFP